MDYRSLGSTPLMISRIGFGCMGMSEFYGPTDDAKSLEVLERAFDLGINFFDTADMYGRGHNEELVGRFLRGKHDRAVVATKCGIVRDDSASGRRVDTSPAYIRAACEASLRRLGVERIDLYYLHRLDAVTAIEDSMGALADLTAEGKIHAVGLSEVTVPILDRAAIHPVSAVQSEFSLVTRDAAVNAVIDACARIGATFVAYSPLGRGLLTAAATTSAALAENDFRRTLPRFQPGALEHNVALAKNLEDIAGSKGVTAAQVALAWVMARAPHVTPIPGTRRLDRLVENIGAAGLSLSPDDIRRIGEALPVEAVAGARYPTSLMPGEVPSAGARGPAPRG